MNRPRIYISAAIALVVVVAVIVVIAIAFKPGSATDRAATSSPPTNPDQSLLLTLNDFPEGYTEGIPVSSSEAANQQQAEPWDGYRPDACRRVFNARAEQTARTTRTGFVAKGPTAATPTYGQYLIHNNDDLEQMRATLLDPQCLTVTIDTHKTGIYTMQTSELASPAMPEGVHTLLVKYVTDITNAPANYADHYEVINGFAWLPTGSVAYLSAEVDGRGNTVDISQFNDLFANAVKKASR